MKVVLDASAAVELLLGSESGRRVAETLVQAQAIHCPELLYSEVLSALRGLLRAGKVLPEHARRAIEHLGDLDIEPVSTRTLAPLVWELSEAHSTYDAHYVALGRSLDAIIVTADAKLARALPEVAVHAV